MSSAMKLARADMTDAEWQTRCDLAALYHVVHHLGWTDLINTHLSARVPGEPDTFLINRYGEMFDEITASSLIKMDLAGNVIGDERPFNAAGFTIHSGVYKARPDANCVMHTHTRAGAGVSLLRKRAAADQPGRAACAGRPRLPRLRRAGLAGGMRGAGRDLRAGQLRRAAEPRPADLRARPSMAR